ncbi:MAG: hypothetical protein JW995_09815 [Melioribacteraceae bacterium]|nr:hypothetical protein [Melioribacteraceae bacterium]
MAELLLVIFLVVMIVGIVYAIKKGFSSNITTIYGATAELHNKDKKAAMEILVETKANKKMEEQENGEPEVK